MSALTFFAGGAAGSSSALRLREAVGFVSVASSEAFADPFLVAAFAGAALFFVVVAVLVVAFFVVALVEVFFVAVVVARSSSQ